MAQRSPETQQPGRDHRENGWSLRPLQPPQPHAAGQVMPQGWDLGARQGTVQVVPVTPPGDSLAQPAEHGEVLGGVGCPVPPAPTTQGGARGPPGRCTVPVAWQWVPGHPIWTGWGGPMPRCESGPMPPVQGVAVAAASCSLAK